MAAAVLFALRLGTGALDALRPSPSRDLIHWAGAENAPTNRPILYYFSAKWCRPCKRLQREVFVDPKVAAVVNETFVCVRVDDDDDGPRARSLRETYRVEGVPTLIIARPGAEPSRQDGYRGKRATIAFLTRPALASGPSSKRH
jgi:thiol:disulfide interchange protein